MCMRLTECRPSGEAREEQERGEVCVCMGGGDMCVGGVHWSSVCVCVCVCAFVFDVCVCCSVVGTSVIISLPMQGLEGSREENVTGSSSPPPPPPPPPSSPLPPPTCTCTRTHSHRPYFSFDPAVVKKVNLSRSNDSLDKAMEDPVRPSEEEPTSSEVVIHPRSRNRERRFSAPPERRIRDSVGSMDYLSESQGEWGQCCVGEEREKGGKESETWIL